MFRIFKPAPKPLPEPLLQPSHIAEFNEKAAELSAQVQEIAAKLEQAMQGDSEREKILKERVEALEQENASLRTQLDEARKREPDAENSGASLQSPPVVDGDVVDGDEGSQEQPPLHLESPISSSDDRS